uniref:Uncharacterized protein n=1 Tax=Glossina pallidipes TaxID=7398 RepID=A0A1A9Z1Z5_GLOPL
MATSERVREQWRDWETPEKKATMTEKEKPNPGDKLGLVVCQFPTMVGCCVYGYSPELRQQIAERNELQSSVSRSFSVISDF